MDKYTLTAGGIIGRYHLQRRKNYQDAFRSYENDDYIIGVVCDGCGSGDYSEVGANLIASWSLSAAKEWAILGLSGEISLWGYVTDVVATRIREACTSEETTEFILTHFLATLLLVFIDKYSGESRILCVGDGVVVFDNENVVIDQNNEPEYLGYEVIRGRPSIYKTFFIVKEAMWSRIGIATDGVEVELIDELLKCESSLKLQRRLNVLSEQEHRFKDDATMIFIKRTPNV